MLTMSAGSGKREPLRVGILGLSLELSFEYGYPLSQWIDELLDFGRGVAWRDVLRAVPIEGDDVDKEDPLHDALNLRLCELCYQLGMFARILHPRVAEDFQPRTLRIVHQEKSDAITYR